VGWKRGYYYSGGRYVGKDWIARVHAAIDADHAAIKREMRDLAREQKQAEREAFQEARQRAAKVDSIVARGFEAVGLYRQDRHQWKRRLATMKKLETNAPATEKAVLDLAEIARFAYVMKAFGESPEHEERLHDKLDALHTELIGPRPACAALRLAVELACYCWLDKWAVEVVASQNALNVSPALDRRRNWAGRRFLQALAAVERIRRLTRAPGPRVAVQIINQPNIPDFELPTFELPEWKKFED
jgi:hypothetical protein